MKIGNLVVALSLSSSISAQSVANDAYSTETIARVATSLATVSSNHSVDDINRLLRELARLQQEIRVLNAEYAKERGIERNNLITDPKLKKSPGILKQALSLKDEETLVVQKINAAKIRNAAIYQAAVGGHRKLSANVKIAGVAGIFVFLGGTYYLMNLMNQESEDDFVEDGSTN